MKLSRTIICAFGVFALVCAGCSDEGRRGNGGDNNGGANNAANNGDENNQGNNGGNNANNANNNANNASNNGSNNNNASNNNASNNNNTGAPCTDNERRCASASELTECVDGVWESIQTCQGGQVCAVDRCTTEISCEPGEVEGCFGDQSRRVCNAAGNAFEQEACEAGLNCFDGVCSDQVCRPMEQRCADRDNLEVCNNDGSAYEALEVCPAGAVCLEGACLSGCALSEKFPSYIGCQYWSLDLDNYPDPAGDPAAVPHAVVVSNPSARDAVVTISTLSDVPAVPSEFMVPAGGVEVYTFPRNDVDGTGISYNSYFLESSWPVVMYQFNPLNNEGVASNDASLLIPSEFLGTEYYAVSWPTSPVPDVFMLPPQHGYVTIVATREGVTDVEVTVSGDVVGGPNIPYLVEGETYNFSLNRYQVLNLEAAGEDIFNLNDMTGTHIVASQPIAVFGGHEEAVVALDYMDRPGDRDSCCAEHLEQQLFPVSTWGRRYLAVQSEPRGDSEDVWRIMASERETTVTFIPPQDGMTTTTLGPGEFVQVHTGESFEVTGDKPLQVAQYLESAQTTERGVGDPALIMAVPITQFRDEYTVLTPMDYSSNFLTITRPAGATCNLDGAPISDAQFTSFGSGNYEYVWVSVSEGVHTVNCAEPFALTAYGYSNAVSYGYPGGMDLRIEPAGE